MVSGRLLVASLAAASLCACEDWDQLSCGLRHVCGGDAGAFQLQAGFDDEGALAGVAAGVGSQAVLTSRSLVVFDDAGVEVATAAPSTAWVALGAVGSPTRFFVVDGAGAVRSWLEPRRPEYPLLSGASTVALSPQAAVGTLDDAGAPSVAVFGVASGGTWGAFLDSRGSLLAAGNGCELVDLEGGAIQGWTSSVVVGIASGCEARYVASFWPRDVPSPPPVILSAEPSPTRVRVGANGDAATIAYETRSGITVARVVDGGVQPAVSSVFLGGVAGASLRSMLESVQQLDAGRFLYVLLNPNPASVNVTPDEVGGKPVTIPAGAAMVVFSRWVGASAAQVTGTQVLLPGRPFSRVRLALDPHQPAVWLAAACPRALDGGVFDTYCPGPEAHVALLRWVP